MTALWCVMPGLLCLAIGAGADPTSRSPARAAQEIVPQECLAIGSVGHSGRLSPVHTDAIENEIVQGTWTPPKTGDTVALPDGTQQAWTRVAADKDGVFHDPALAGGYAYIPIDISAPQVMILEAASHSMVSINGAPRTGDIYGYGYTRLPVALHAGVNDLLFSCGRSGELKVRLVPPTAPALLNISDPTLPDLMAGKRENALGAVIALNATNQTLTGLTLRAQRAGAPDTLTPLPPLPPLVTRKVPFHIAGRAPDAAGTVDVTLTLEQKTGAHVRTLDTAKIALRVRTPGETYKTTFISAIDGSVQYYAVNPAQPLPGERADALFLTLHGASVEAIGQADAYSPKSWGSIVAPTNRRPYGFDWEDWGRLDALEVLDLAEARFRPDPSRVYLTGHSMGGHGTWQVGVLFPDRFAAIGPSAGWVSFFSYTGAKQAESPTPMEAMLERANLPSDTLAMEHNYTHEGVYILHGSADDNVPVTESRTMAQRLSAFHHDFVYHEQPNVGHWWDISDEPGADCVDWAPLFDFFAHHAIPGEQSVRQVDFVTPDPGISARSQWVTVESQVHRLQLSTVSLRYDPGKRRFVGTTDNVARLALDLRRVRPDGVLTLEIDGQKLENVAYPAAQTLYLARAGGVWSVAGPLPPGWETPQRCGPFKQAFCNHMLFVYGTRGDPQENAWALAKARYDAEQFWYRGNGAIDIVADKDFDASKDRDRNVIMYGNADTNSAWSALLAGSPVQVRRHDVKVGSHEFAGDDLACLFVRPRPGSDTASVGVVSGSGLIGMRLADRQPYFGPGVAYPDCLVLGADMLTKGIDGVRLAGFFGPDWGVDSGEFVTTPPKTMTKTNPKEYLCYRTGGPMHIDGKLDEPSWQAAPWTDDFVDIQGDSQPRPRFRTRARMLWDDKYLYIGAELQEPYVWATLTQHDSVIYNDNDFEIFIDPNGDNQNYYEIEINALNTEWDLRLVKPYRDGGPYLNSWEIPGLKSAVHIDGTLNDPRDTDRGWSVEMAIPWTVLAEFAGRPAPPADGDQWRLNFSRVEWKVTVADDKYAKVPDTPEDNWVWSPQGAIDMHRPEKWGYVQFSTAPPGTAVFRPDPSAPARELLMAVYYAQKEYQKTHGTWAAALSDLNLPTSPDPTLRKTLEMRADAQGFEAAVEYPLPAGGTQRLHVRQDSRLWND